jgi:hypothetical protein
VRLGPGVTVSAFRPRADHYWNAGAARPPVSSLLGP